MQDIPVRMFRPHMCDIPTFDVPAGFRFRPFGRGDADLWVDVQAAANAQFMKITAETFRSEFGGQEHLLPERSWFVVAPDRCDVGSITAWWIDSPDGSKGPVGTHGLIHWVAVLPEHQGKGIGKAMMTQAMRWLVRHYSTALLNTSSGRTGAIKVYLDFGFVPDPTRPDSAAGWDYVRRTLPHAALGNA